MPAPTPSSHPSRLPKLALLLGGFLAAATTGFAQGRATPEPAVVFTDEASVSWVLVPTLVSRRGSPVNDLDRKDFRLRVDGRATPIASFDTDEENPLTLLYFQDLSGSMANGGKLRASHRALGCLLERARPGDSMSLVTFASGQLMVDVPLTEETSVIAESSETWEAYGQTALHDAVTWIPEIRLGPGRRPAAILVTDGIDNASVLDAEAARQMVWEAEIPVYVLALRGSRVSEPGADESPSRRRNPARPRAESGDGFVPYGRVLRRLAESTGGRYFEIWNRNDLDNACITVHRELRGRYTLGFPIESGGDETYRSLQVTVRKQSLTVRHRAGYLGRPPH